MMTYKQWLSKFGYMGAGVTEATMEEVMLDFFYNGVVPMVHDMGYKWTKDEHVIARKFLYLCYSIDTTLKMGVNYDLAPPPPQHRNFMEDLETFYHFLDDKYNNFLENWSFRTEIVGTRFEFLIKEFCYVWIDVTSGRPGAYTQKLLTADDEEQIDEEVNAGPETWSRKNWDLY